MKKISLFSLCLITFLLSCKETEPLEETTQEYQKLTVNSSSDFFYSDPNGNASTGTAFLSNEKGEVLQQLELSNNTSTEFDMDFSTHSSFDFTYLNSRTITYADGKVVKRYFLSTFKDVAPHQFELQHSEKVEEDIRANVQIINTAGNIQNITTSNTVYKNILNSFANIEVRLNNSEEDIYISFLASGEEVPRYVLHQNVENGFSTTHELANLPLAKDKFIIDHSQLEYCFTYIYGSFSDNPREFNSLLSYSKEFTKPNSSVHYIPLNEFAQIKTYTETSKGEKYYRTTEIGNSIQTNYELPAFDFEVINSEVENYEIMPSGDFQYYRITLYFRNSLENYQIQWSQYGKYTDGSIKLDLPDILNSIAAETAGLSINEFELYHTFLFKVQGMDSYMEFNNLMLNPSATLESTSDKIELVYTVDQ